MFVDISVAIRGKSPLLMHRYAGEEPSGEKPPRGKKTQAWIDANRKAKWMKGAYFADGLFHMPPENIEAALFTAARKIRKGNDFKEAVAVVEDFVPLIVYADGDDKKGQHPKGKLEDFYVPEHIDIRGVVIQKSRVDACRPIFRFWGLEFTVRYDSDVLDESAIRTAVEKGSLGDFRPRFGRYMITKFEARRASKAA